MTAHPAVAAALAVLFVAGAVLALTHRRQPGTLPYVALMTVLATMTAAIVATTGDLLPAETAVRLFLFCWYVASVLWAIFAIEYTGRGPVVTRLRAAALLGLGALIPAVSLGIAIFEVNNAAVALLVVPFQITVIALAVFGVFLVARSGVTYDDLPLGRSLSLAVGGTSLTAVFAVPILGEVIGVDWAVILGMALLWVSGVSFLLGQLRLGVFDSDPSTGHLARETVLDQLSEAVLLVDREGQLLAVNETAAGTFGVERPVEQGQSLAAVLGTVPPADTDTPITLVTRAGQREFVCRRSDLTRGGDTVGTIHVLRDVTEQRTDEQRLAVLNRVLRHNLRNDLDAIRGFAEPLRDGDCEAVDTTVLAARIEETAAEVASIGDTVEGAERLLKADGIDRKQVDVAELAGRVVERHLDECPGVSGEVSGDAGLVTTDPRILDTVLGELVENALQHNDGPNPRVAVAVTETDRGVELSVRDNGPGIPEHERAVLLEGEETPLNHGSGLGLWLVYWGVRRLGGDLQFGTGDSRGGVTVSLPSLDGETSARLATGA